MFLRKGVLKICSKFTEEHPHQNAISIKLQSNFIEIALQHGCSPLNLLHILRTPFSKNTSGRLLLMNSISRDMFLNNIDSKGIENLQHVVKSVVNYLVNMVDGLHDDAVGTERCKTRNRHLDMKIEKRTQNRGIYR